MTDSIRLLQDSIATLQTQLLQAHDTISADSASIGLIRGYVEKLAHDGGFDLWDWVAILIAFISLVIAWIMAVWQKRTERNTMKITKEGQIGLLVDYVRHFYTNLVVIVSVNEKLGRRFSTHYPSQEHFRKLTVDLEVLHPEAFFHSKEKYELVHKLLVLVRNYNIEVGVAEEHVCSRDVFAEAKERDINTLIFKPNLFCESFVKCIGDLSDESYPLSERIYRKYPVIEKLVQRIFHHSRSRTPKYTYSDYLLQIRQSIIDEAIRRTSFNPELFNDITDNPALKREKKEALINRRKLELIIKGAKDLPNYYNPERSPFADLIFPDDKELFFDLLNHNIHTEINAKNSQNYPKIFIIPFADKA